MADYIKVMVIIVLGLLFGCSEKATSLADKQIVGETVLIDLPEISLPILARVDSGASLSSIHAMKVDVDEGSNNPKENIGKVVKFTTINGKGESRRFNTQIVKVSKIRNAQGVEYRYVVEMDVLFRGKMKRIAMNLRDRSQLKYKLLMGRNWLQGDYLIDVDSAEAYHD